MTQPTTKGFFEYAADDGSIPEGTYLFEVTETEVGTWDDGRERVDLRTEVVGGEYDGNFGPRITWSKPQRFEGTRKSDGKPFVITEEDSKRTLSNQVAAVMNGAENLTLSDPSTFNEVMMSEIGKQVVGKRFYAKVRKDDGGYVRVNGRLFPLSEPPKGINVAAAGFSVDEY